MTDDDVRQLIADRQKAAEEAAIIRRTPAQDPENYNGFCKSYVAKVANPMQKLTEDDRFNNFIIGIIMLAGLVVGFQTDKYCDTLMIVRVTDAVILSIFIFEVLAKILAEGAAPWRYYFGPEWKWNNFDFIIVVLSLPIPGMSGGGAVKLLRLIRLARLAKLIKKIPALQMIIMGLVGGMVSIGYIMLLLLIVLYLFGIIGYMVFGRNDPWHFGTLSRALMTLFRASTLEDWTDIKYINYFGCDSPYYDSGIYHLDDPYQDPPIQRSGLYWADGCPVTCHSRYDPNLGREIRMWDTTLNASVSRGERIVYKDTPWSIGLYGYKTAENVGWFGMLYWISFILLSALVMLSLFIGAVTMAMTESMEEMKAEQATEKMIKAYQKREDNKIKREKKKAEMRLKRENKRVNEGKARRLTSRSFAREAEEIEQSLKEEITLEQKRARNLIQNAWSDSAMDKLIDFKELEAKEKGSFCLLYYKLSRLAYHVAYGTPHFTNFITVVICVAGLMVGIGIETNAENPDDADCRPGCSYPENTLALPNVTRNLYSQNTLPSAKDIDCIWKHEVSLDCHPDCIDPKPILVVMGALEVLILIIFTAEVIIKVVAEFDHPMRYFYKNGSLDGWNNFDFLIVVGSLLPTGEGGGMLVILRLLRLLRVLKLLKAFPQLQVIVKALISGLGSISYIAMILTLFFFACGILFMIVFGENDPWHFGTLPNAIYSLFRASTLEDWTDIMYTNMYGCANYGHFVMCEDIGMDNCAARMADPKDLFVMHEMYCCCREISDRIYGPDGNPVLYEWLGATMFLFFTVIGALVLMTLFIGVITTAMEEAQSNQKKEKEEEELEKATIEAYGYDSATVEKYRKVFNIIDEDGSGLIDEDEMRSALQFIGQEEESLEDIYNIIGNEDKNEISFPQFLGMLKELKRRETESMELDGSVEETNSGDEVVDSKDVDSIVEDGENDEKSIEMTSVTINNPMIKSIETTSVTINNPITEDDEDMKK
eukprot:g4975.t1